MQLAALLCAVLAAGCGGKVVCRDGTCGGAEDGDGGSAGIEPTTGPGNPTGGAGGAGAGGAPAYAVLTEGGSFATLSVASFPLRCTDPDAVPPWDQCGWFSLAMSFDASLIATGVVDTAHPSFSLQYSEATDPSGPSGDCALTATVSGGGSAPILDSMIFQSVTDRSVVVEFAGVISVSHRVDGTYTAPRCSY